MVVINGPTASGKSGLAVDGGPGSAGARGSPAEVINTDSMLVYRGMGHRHGQAHGWPNGAGVPTSL